ncbi:hypothetical protein [Halomonas salinarum]|uniref:hypothetical protein n=1 Tax=Halomonas salinarum TaxID=1158993 RepID=UPI0014392353|nr:hypothetical protein [Halomonas salinarum]
MTKKAQNGRSLKLNLENVSTKNLVEICDLTYEQAERIINTRRVLKVQGDDDTNPQIDARRLWVKIGRPYKRFRDWAESYIKPELDENTFAEKSAKGQIEIFFEETKGRPRNNYLLSRRVAAKLAMQANTKEGDQIREYFLDVEKIVMKLWKVRVIRSESLSAHDKAIYRAVVSGDGGNRDRAEKAQKDIRNMVPEVLSGKGASWWREEFGKGIRDVLDNEDLIIYDKAIELSANLIKGGMRSKKQIREIVEANHGGSIRVNKYLDNT